MAFVVDASMVMAWHFPNEATLATEAVFALSDTETLVVPRHWFSEVSNVLLVGERRKRTSAAQTGSFVQRLSSCLLDVDELEDDAIFSRIMPLARAHGLTVYDTFYLELAGRRGLALATLDHDLAKAARSVGIEIIGQDQ
jgi:predicted nucleic acid-binding protein